MVQDNRKEKKALWDLLQSRRTEEKENVFWNPFRRDAQTIVSSKSFARIQDKPQVVYLLPHDHITNRSLHVQAVSLYARTIGEHLGLDSSLIEAIALGHDLGHPPFGHEGEKYLSLLSLEYGIGPFSHALQSCRLAEILEPMNLTLAVLDGFLCHDGGLQDQVVVLDEKESWEAYEKKRLLREKDEEVNLAPMTQEGLLVKLCDTACYVARDIEDAITLGIIRREDVPDTLLGKEYHTYLDHIANDILDQKRKNGRIEMSLDVFQSLKTLRSFNFDTIYYHSVLKSESKKIESAYQLLFHKILASWKQKGKESILWTHFLHSKNAEYVEKSSSILLVRDFIAGMTDGYFLRLFHELFVPKTIEVPHVLPFHG